MSVIKAHRVKDLIPGQSYELIGKNVFHPNGVLQSTPTLEIREYGFDQFPEKGGIGYRLEVPERKISFTNKGEIIIPDTANVFEVLVHSIPF
ncbi:MAG: hypothetical protein KKF68_03970 [Nanoarchaeota archaeon]|nr:hypothetical protein [Nanoarchaeota archaeon]